MESITYMVAGQTFELQHHGVKGMKWGVRKRYLNADGSLNDRGVKKYAKKGYAQDSFRSNKTVAGKAWDAYTGAHKTQASIQYDLSSKKQNRARAEKYLADKQKSSKNNQKQTAKRGAKAVVKALQVVGTVYALDMAYTGGAVTRGAAKAGKAAVKNAMSKIGDRLFDYSILDASGKTIYRYN